MSYNNTVTITGNTGAEAKEIILDNGKIFAAVTLYTSDSYKDENEQWQQLKSVRHNVVAFDPRVIADLKFYKQGARLKITGVIKYRPFDVVVENGEVVTKYEATIIAKKVETASLPKKANTSLQTRTTTEQQAPVMA